MQLQLEDQTEVVYGLKAQGTESAEYNAFLGFTSYQTFLFANMFVNSIHR